MFHCGYQASGAANVEKSGVCLYVVRDLSVIFVVIVVVVVVVVVGTIVVTHERSLKSGNKALGGENINQRGVVSILVEGKSCRGCNIENDSERGEVDKRRITMVGGLEGQEEPGGHLGGFESFHQLQQVHH